MDSGTPPPRHLPLLYQAGYLTIKGYDFNRDLYTLDFPNAEVKVGFMEMRHFFA